MYQSLVDTAQPLSQMQCYPCRAVVPCCRPPEKVRNVASGREIGHCTSDMAVDTRKILQGKIGDSLLAWVYLSLKKCLR